MAGRGVWLGHIDSSGIFTSLETDDNEEFGDQRLARCSSAPRDSGLTRCRYRVWGEVSTWPSEHRR
jgi:hypothetical protein